MKYINSGALMGVSFSLPSSLATVRQAMNIIKKSISSKVVKRAYAMLVAQNKEHKKHREQILDTVANTLNAPAQITVFGKVADSGATKKKTDVLVSKLKAMLPKRLDHGSKGAKLNYDPIKAKDVYREISLGGSFPV